MLSLSFWAFAAFAQENFDYAEGKLWGTADTHRQMKPHLEGAEPDVYAPRVHHLADLPTPMPISNPKTTNPKHNPKPKHVFSTISVCHDFLAGKCQWAIGVHPACGVCVKKVPLLTLKRKLCTGEDIVSFCEYDTSAARPLPNTERDHISENLHLRGPASLPGGPSETSSSEFSSIAPQSSLHRDQQPQAQTQAQPQPQPQAQPQAQPQPQPQAQAQRQSNNQVSTQQERREEWLEQTTEIVQLQQKIEELMAQSRRHES